jgi:3-oxoadipate enol-lactonase
MHTCSVNGIDLRYVLADFTDPWREEKEYLLLLHGWMGCAQSWVRQIPYFARDFVVIAPDLRGFGRSSKPARGYAFEDYARDLEALLDALEIDRAHVLGQSFGGVVGQTLAILCPDRVQSLILWATRSEPTGSTSAEAVADFIRREGMPAFAEYFSGSYADEAEPAITEWNKQLVAKGASHVAIETLREISRTNLTPRLGMITAPTLILASREDKVIPFKFAETMKKNIANSQLYEYNGSHGAYLKNPDECNRVILKFLRELPRRKKQ